MGETKERSQTMLAALPAALILPAVAILSFVLRGAAPGERFSSSAVFAVLASVTLFAFVAVTKSSRPRAGVLAACHALAWAPFLAVGAWQSIDAAIVSRPQMRCGTGLMGLLMVVVPVGVLLLLALGTAAGVVFVRRTTDRAIRTAAFGVTGLALVAFAFGAARIKRPDPDTYLASLEEITVLHEGATAILGGRVYEYKKGTPSVRTAEDGEVPPRSVECILTGLDEPVTFYAADGRCKKVRFRGDHGRDIGVIDDGSWGPVVAFRPSTGETIAITPALVADHIAPPIGWTVGAGLGGLIGAACLVAASRIRRRAAAIEAREGKHAGGGVVELDTGETLRVDAAVGLPPGTVVLGDVREQLPSYRQIAAPTFGAAWAGTLDDLRGNLTDLAASLDAVALTAAMLGATPLLIARLAAGL